MSDVDKILEIFQKLYDEVKYKKGYSNLSWHNEVRALRVLLLLAITKNKPAALALKEAWEELSYIEKRVILNHFSSEESAAKVLTKVLIVIFEVISRVRGRVND